jgi:20S proteasome alpha/beta subunit
MSIIVGIKNKEGVILGADKQITKYNTASHSATKIIQMRYSNTAMGTVGYLRDVNIINSLEEIIGWEDIVKKTLIDEKYITKYIIPKLFDFFEKYNRVEKENNICEFLSEFIFVTSTDLFLIDEDGAIDTKNNYVALGCGEEKVYGYLNTLENISQLNMKECENIIKKAIKQSCKDDIYIDNNIDFIKLYKNT